MLIVCAALLCGALLYAVRAGHEGAGERSPTDGEARTFGQADPGTVDPGQIGSGQIDRGISLEQIAEIERAGAYFPGLALAESGFRENAGDYAGAAVAAYKELSWAYGSGNATRSQVEEGLLNALGFFDGSSTSIDIDVDIEQRRNSGLDAIRGCIAFVREDWALAEKLLTGILSPDEEPDSFLRWMLLVCALEREDKAAGDKAQAARSAYGAIRARYALFPEYWYRGARAEDGNIAAAYAEQCVNTSPQGPFAGNCREIIINHLGIAADARSAQGRVHSDIRTKAEIENIIRASVAMNKPEILEDLFPLMALPDNPYTFYALGAMKSLSSVPEFRVFFIDGAIKSPGRLGERLNYISRG